MTSLPDWGFDAAWQAAFAPHARLGLVPARVIQQHRDHVVVVHANADGVRPAPADLPHRAESVRQFPVVGDFVALLPRDGARPLVSAVLPRRTTLARRDTGRDRKLMFREVDAEVMVANADHVLVLSSLNSDFSPRRIERFLAQIWEGGAQPVVLLTKADLADDVEARIAAAIEVSPGAPVHAVSALHGDGIAALAPYLAPGRTVAFVGSSGVGKSTLLNALVGGAVQVVRAIREHDDTGVHTTTARAMFRLPCGACAIDTPGIREFGLLDAGDGVEAAFADIGALAARCRFRDCAHSAEPGCAVRTEIEAGRLSTGRLESYRLLKRELAFAASKERKRERAIRHGQRDARREFLERPAEEDR